MGVWRALTVRVGESVRPGKGITRAIFDSKGPMSSISARIVNGEMSSRAVFGLHNIVFLNRGSEDGLQVGNILPVLKNVRARNPSAVVRADPKPIGTLKVVNI